MGSVYKQAPMGCHAKKVKDSGNDRPPKKQKLALAAADNESAASEVQVNVERG